MKRVFCKKLLVYFAVFSLLFTSLSFVYAAEDAKKSGESVADPEEVLRQYATKKGSEYGEMYAGRDYMKGLKSSAKRHFSTTSSVYSFFKMTSDTSKHKSIFYEAFIKAFRAKYEETYITVSAQDRDNNEAFWFNVAKKYAKVEGEIAAYYDHLNESPESWESAYKMFVANESLNVRFRLFRYSGTLPKNFELDFKLAFKKSYEEAYANAIIQDNELNTNYYYVDSEPTDISYERSYSEVVKSAFQKLNFPKVELSFPSRTVLTSTPMAIRYKQYMDRTNPLNLIQLSDIYELELQRGIDSVEFHRSPTLKINGYAVRGAGIYKRAYERWHYVYTTTEDKLLSTDLDTGVYKNSEYGVFIDQNYVMPSDISFNWAFKEIYTAIRRHHVPQFQKFRPDESITRVDLADMIYRTLSYRSAAKTNPAIPSDVEKLAYGKGSVQYCLAKGYMTMDRFGNFAPLKKVTYTDFEQVMKRIYKKDFSIAEMANTELKTKYHRSDYITKATPYISRAEVVYALDMYLD